MFQNKIISDLQWIISTAPKFPTEKDKARLKYLTDFLGLALNSHYFFFGHELVLSSMFGVSPKTEGFYLDDFYKKYKPFFKLPYPKTAFEFTMSPAKWDGISKGPDGEEVSPVDKSVCYIEERKDAYLLTEIPYFTRFQGWRPSMEILKIHKDSGEIWGHTWVGSGYEYKENKPSYGMANSFVNSVMCTVLLNCKNVRTDTVNADLALQLARKRRGKLPIFSYKTITIDLGKRREPMKLSGAKPLEHNRLHLCRGHFKRYTEKRPLLGKHVGLWWWVPHVRGKNYDGIVMKDYCVMTH